MSEGIKSVVYPVSDLAKAKAMFSAALNAAPIMDERAPRRTRTPRT